MDVLLMKRLSQLTDERKEIFGLMDRFFATIEDYKRQYASTVDKMNKDLHQRNTEKQETLKRLRNLQDREQKRILRDHTDIMESIRGQILNRQNQASLELQEQEGKIAQTEKSEKAELNAAYSADIERIKKYRETRNHIQKVLSIDVDVLLGETLTGVSKLQKIRDSFDISAIIVKDRVSALKAVDSSQISEANSLYDEIQSITESLPRKVIFNQKRIFCIESLIEMDALAEEAIQYLEMESQREQQDRKKKSDDRCSCCRMKCNNNKQNIIRERDGAVEALQEKQNQEQKKYQELSARMAVSHNENYAKQERYFAAQIANASTQWKSELKHCNDSFVSQMEEKYPAKRMNGWLNQFWYHPRNVEDYSKADFQQMNTLIGVAEVNISDWYSGDTGVVIKQVLMHYICLFGRNKEQAAKAYKEAKISLPYTISIEEGTSLLISYADGLDERAKGMLNAIGMRLLRSVPACQMRFQLFDANGIGAFGRLMSIDPAIGNNPSEPNVKSFTFGEGGQVSSNHADISAQILETKITMDDLSRQLTNYVSIREFNTSNPLSKQIYRPMLMMNFPLGLEESEISTLNAMTLACSKWGFFMVLAQPDKAINVVKPKMQRVINELRKNMLCLRMENNDKGLKVIRTNSAMEARARVFLYALPDSSKIPRIAREIREKSVEASRVLIRFTEAKGICPRREQWFTQKADDGIVVPVGYLEGGQPFRLQFDDKHVHSIVMGNTGSGKTNLLHVIMTNIMLRYAPEEVMIYLIDFKYGLDFRMYTQFNLPNFRTISINNDPEFALAMLQNLEKEQRERSDRMGSKYQKISEYNAANPNDRMNRIILIVDELYELTKQAADDVQKSILKKIDSFAHQTRAFGIHMVVSGQDLGKIDNFETIKNQCTTRLALHCDDEQVKMLLDDAGVVRMHTIDSNDQGACVFSLSAGSNPQIEHTTYLGAEQQEHILEQIHRYYLVKKQITRVKVLLTKVSDNPNHPIQMFLTKGYQPDMVNNRLLLGEPISMERELNLYPIQNLWVTGGDVTEESMEGGCSMMFFAAVSLLLAKLKYNNLDILCTNCSDQPMRSIEMAEKDLIGQLTSHYPSLFRYCTGGEYRKALASMMDELDKRKSNAKLCERILWWFLIKPEMVDGMGDDSTLVIDLKELLQNGSKYNMHIILWNADIKKAQKMQIDRTIFKDRICLEMSAEDSKLVNGSELKPIPEGLKAIFIGDYTMRFRIYDLPDGKWMNALFGRLNYIINQ